MPSNAKELHSFLGLAFYYHWFILNFTCIAKCLHHLVGPTNVKKTKGKRKKAISLEELKNKLDVTLPKFVWASEHQKAFDATKTNFNYSPSAGIPQF